MSKRSEPTRQDLAAQIEHEHQAARSAAEMVVAHAVECGELLIEAKAGLAHAEWLPWLEEYTTVSARQAQVYMRLARHRAEIEAANAQRDSHLPIRDAIALLADHDKAEAHLTVTEPLKRQYTVLTITAEPEPIAVRQKIIPQPARAPDPDYDFLFGTEFAWRKLDVAELAARCHDPEGLRDTALRELQRLQMLIAALDRRLRAGGRAKLRLVAQPPEDPKA
jgi:Protein of unknown function (DUF3102)